MKKIPLVILYCLGLVIQIIGLALASLGSLVQYDLVETKKYLTKIGKLLLEGWRKE